MNIKEEISSIIERQVKYINTVYSIKGGFIESTWDVLGCIKKMVKKVNKSKLKQAYTFDEFFTEYGIIDDYTQFILTDKLNDIRLSKEESLEKVKDCWKMIYIEISLLECSTEDLLKELASVMDSLKNDESFDIDKDDHNGNFDIASDEILNIVQDNMVYLNKTENLPQLGFLMWIWENIFHLGRISSDVKSIDMPDLSYQCGNNPKYEIEDGCKLSYENEQQENNVYSAWSNAVDAVHDYGDKNSYHSAKMFLNLIEPVLSEDEQKFQDLNNKVNKTMDEWIELKTNPRYIYHSMYPDSYSVRDHMLCTIGNGYDWNKDGFLCSNNGGTDTEYFAGFKYQLENLPEKAKTALEKILNDEFILKYSEEAFQYVQDEVDKRLAKKKKSEIGDIDMDSLKELMAKFKEENPEKYEETFGDDDGSDDLFEAEKRNRHYPVCNYSGIRCIPANVHESYIPHLQKTMEELLSEDRSDKESHHSRIEEINEAIKDFPHIFADYKIYPFVTSKFSDGYKFNTITTEQEDGTIETKKEFKSQFLGDKDFFHYEISTDKDGNETRVDYNKEGDKLDAELS